MIEPSTIEAAKSAFNILLVMMIFLGLLVGLHYLRKFYYYIVEDRDEQTTEKEVKTEKKIKLPS